MDILLYKDGHLSISESPLQGKENDLDDVVMLVSNPQEGDTLTYKGGKWVNGEGGGGSGGGVLVVHANGDTPMELILDKTWQEIYDALNSGSYVVLLEQWEEGTTQRPILQADFSDGNYFVYADRFTYAATSADGYPTTSYETSG